MTDLDHCPACKLRVGEKVKFTYIGEGIPAFTYGESITGVVASMWTSGYSEPFIRVEGEWEGSRSDVPKSDIFCCLCLLSADWKKEKIGRQLELFEVYDV